jgi:hypothetical protein
MRISGGAMPPNKRPGGQGVGVMNGINKTSLEQIEVGDYVAYQASSSWGNYPLRYAVVTAVTKTQIVIGEKRFNKADGWERTSNSYHDLIFPLGAQDNYPFGHSDKTYAQKVEIEQAEHKDASIRYKFAKFITEQSARRLAEKFDSATLEQAAKLLGYSEDKFAK